MQMIKYLSILGLFFFFCSCAVNLDDEITVTRNRSGELNIRVVDSESNPLQSSEISILEHSLVLQSGTTDASGYYHGGKLLEGFYSYGIVAKKGKVTYFTDGTFTIVAKNGDVIELNALENTGTFDIAVVDKETSEPIFNPENYGMALVQLSDIDNFSSVEKLKENAHFIADLGNNGKVLIKEIPSGMGYAFYLFHKHKDEYVRFLIYNVFKGKTREIVLQKY